MCSTNGHHKRDFTYVDDIAEGVVARLVRRVAEPDPKWNSNSPDPSSSSAPFSPVQHRQQ